MPPKPRTKSTGGATEKKRKRDDVDSGKSKVVRAKRAKIASKATKKKVPFYGITKTAKAKGQGFTKDEYDAKTIVNKFRKLEANKYMSQGAAGVKDVKLRRNVMKDSWNHANKLAREKYGDLMRKNNIDPMTFRRKK